MRYAANSSKMTRDVFPQPSGPDQRERDEALLREAEARLRLRNMRGKRQFPPAPSIGMAARKAVRPALKGHKGSPISVLKSRWKEMVGDKLAPLCEPIKFSGKPGKRTLTLKVLPAAALLIQHQSETLRQRISASAGGDIVKISLIQGALSKSHIADRKTTRKLTASEKQELEKSLEHIEEPGLREALFGLGAQLISEHDVENG